MLQKYRTNKTDIVVFLKKEVLFVLFCYIVDISFFERLYRNIVQKKSHVCYKVFFINANMFPE